MPLYFLFFQKQLNRSVFASIETQGAFGGKVNKYVSYGWRPACLRYLKFVSSS